MTQSNLVHDIFKEPRDFFNLFQHYCAADLISAGATKENMAAFADHTLPLRKMEKIHSVFQQDLNGRLRKTIAARLCGLNW